MKIEKFLDWIIKTMLYYPNIDFKTIKMFIDKFYFFLSDKEKQRNDLSIQMIREFTTKQISLEQFVQDAKTEILESKLHTIKSNNSK